MEVHEHPTGLLGVGMIQTKSFRKDRQRAFEEVPRLRVMSSRVEDLAQSAQASDRVVMVGTYHLLWIASARS
ncbi:MAG TPA: hypothetical protein VFZ66_27930 [Herpetosiphonaceae bacterium]